MSVWCCLKKKIHTLRPRNQNERLMNTKPRLLERRCDESSLSPHAQSNDHERKVSHEESLCEKSGRGETRASERRRYKVGSQYPHLLRRRKCVRMIYAQF
jgi:hypothetical protein